MLCVIACFALAVTIGQSFVASAVFDSYFATRRCSHPLWDYAEHSALGYQVQQQGSYDIDVGI